MNRRRALVLGGAALFAMNAWAVETAPPLEFGIFPYLSPRALLMAHQPLKLFIEERLGHPLQLSTATNYESFNERTLRGDYDLLITPPHFARLAQVEAQYAPLAVYSKVLRGSIAVHKDSALTDVRQLRGKAVAAPDRLAIVTLVGTRFLAENGLRANRDYSLLTFTSHASAVHAAAQGEAEAVLTEVATFQKQIPAEVRDELRILSLVGSLPHVMYMAHPRLGAQRIEALRTGLVEFARDTPEGRRFIEANGFEGIRSIADADMKAMDPYVAELHNLIKK